MRSTLQPHSARGLGAAPRQRQVAAVASRQPPTANDDGRPAGCTAALAHWDGPPVLRAPPGHRGHAPALEQRERRQVDEHGLGMRSGVGGTLKLWGTLKPLKQTRA